MGLLLASCGLILAATSAWSAFRDMRAALTPIVRPGDPTRAAIFAARPLHDRPAVRQCVRCGSLAVGWLVLALYGLFLASAGFGLGGLA